MAWFSRRSTPWVLVVLQASGGAFAVGLLGAGWMLAQQRHDPVPCFMDMCETEIALATVYLSATYFVASAGAGLALAVSEATGAGSSRVRSLLAVIGPPAMWVSLVSLLFRY